MMGLASTPGPGPLQATLVTLFGSVLGVAALSLYAIGGFGWLHEKGCTQWQWTRGWAAIAFRVGAAWATAIAALGLALSAAGTR